jgi:hypothetical protein
LGREDAQLTGIFPILTSSQKRIATRSSQSLLFAPYSPLNFF